MPPDTCLKRLVVATTRYFAAVNIFILLSSQGLNVHYCVKMAMLLCEHIAIAFNF